MFAGSGVLLVCCLMACGGVEPRERITEHRDAVIGGEAEPDAYGFALASDVKNAMIAVTRKGQPLCSGTIIGDRLVVSAGHCFVGNSQAWVDGADPEPLSSTQVAALEVRVGPNIEAPDCVLGVAEAILNPKLALRDLDTEGSHANPHDSAMLLLEASVFEACPGVWPARARVAPLTDAVEGQEGLQGGYGANTEDGLPTNYERFWSHFTIDSIHELDVEVDPLEGSHVWYGDSGSGILLATEDGGVEVIGTVSNMLRHARLDIDADWLGSLFVDGALCGPASPEGICMGDALVTCTPETAFTRVDCTESGLACTPVDGGAKCACPCEPCDPSCECATQPCEEPVEDDDEHPRAEQGEGDGCATRSAGSSDQAPLVLVALLGWVLRRRCSIRASA